MPVIASQSTGGGRTSAAEGSGLAIELDAPVARDSTSPADQGVAMPGLVHVPRLVLRRTVMPGDNDCYNWINTALFNTITRRDITLSRLDSSGSPAVVWKFANAFPVKLEYSPLESRNSGPMMEALEIVHAGMTVQNQ